MTPTDLENLRRARRRLHRQIGLLEPLLEGYHAKLASLEARIAEIQPELSLPPRKYAPNPLFKRNELPRLVLTILREAGEPLATKEIAARALAGKTFEMPYRRAMKRTRVQLQKMFADWQGRGLVVKVGEGRGTKRRLAKQNLN